MGRVLLVAAIIVVGVSAPFLLFLVYKMWTAESKGDVDQLEYFDFDSN